MLFRLFNDFEGDAVFWTAAGIEEFGLAQNFAAR